MEINLDELRERYNSLSTDELLQIKISSDLTKEAKSLLEAELSKRDVTSDDYKHAIQVEVVLKADHETVKKDLNRKFRRIIIVLVLIAILVVCSEYFT